MHARTDPPRRRFPHLLNGRGNLLALLDPDDHAVVVLVPVLERVSVDLGRARGR